MTLSELLLGLGESKRDMPEESKFKPVTEDKAMDALEATAAFPEIPPLPPNQCVLAVRPAADRVHTLLRLTFDVTHLTEDKQKLLTFMLSKALTKLEKHVIDMGKIEAAAQLGKLERVKAMKGNGA